MSYSSDIKQQLSEINIKKDCCKSSYLSGYEWQKLEQKCDKDIGCYLRGIFIRCGSISAPGRNFMLSLTLSDDAFADYLSEQLDECGLTARRSVRKGKPVLYYKASESIEDFLSFIGATKAALDIISKKILSEVSNNMNRINNAEVANLDRTARAAAEQREAIAIIEKHGAMHNLNAELRECAELRVQYPDMSLSELRTKFREPVSKSGLNHRFKKLIEIAEMLKNA